MSINWNYFLDFAAILMAQPVADVPAEIQYRVIVSRAYYAAFHAARLHLEDYYGHRWNLERDSHNQVIDYYERPEHQGYLRVAEDLLRLKRWRVRADYHANMVINHQTAQDSITLATRIISAIADLP